MKHDRHLMNDESRTNERTLDIDTIAHPLREFPQMTIEYTSLSVCSLCVVILQPDMDTDHAREAMTHQLSLS